MGSRKYWLNSIEHLNGREGGKQLTAGKGDREALIVCLMLSLILEKENNRIKGGGGGDGGSACVCVCACTLECPDGICY